MALLRTGGLKHNVMHCWQKACQTDLFLPPANRLRSLFSVTVLQSHFSRFFKRNYR
jgi:hypothetical protein